MKESNLDFRPTILWCVNYAQLKYSWNDISKTTLRRGIRKSLHKKRITTCNKVNTGQMAFFKWERFCRNKWEIGQCTSVKCSFCIVWHTCMKTFQSHFLLQFSNGNIIKKKGVTSWVFGFVHGCKCIVLNSKQNKS